jgi:hypothetical protein
MCSLFTAIPAVICGMIALSRIKSSQGRQGGKGLAIAGMAVGGASSLCTLPIMVALLLPAVQAAREAARRVSSSNNLKMIGLAVHNYHAIYKSMPPSGVEYSPNPAVPHREQLSWRVRLLPYLDQQPLYDEFNFNEPWDSPHNQQLISSMPAIFRSPNYPNTTDGKTVYLGIVYPRDGFATPPSPEMATYATGTIFDSLGPGGRRVQPGFPRIRFSSVIDGTSNTIMIVEANVEEAVTWTAPEDLVLDLNDPLRGLGDMRPHGFLVGVADGSVRFVPTSIDDRTALGLFGRADMTNADFEDVTPY